MKAISLKQDRARPVTLQKRKSWRTQLPYVLMLLPAVAILLVYHYTPLAGIVIAFQKYEPVLGFLKSPWVGLDNFRYIFNMQNFPQVMFNTVYIAVAKIVLQTVLCILVSLLLNEIGKSAVKRSVQTLIYFPHFLSWVLLGGIMIDLLSPSTGLVNKAITALGGEPIFFLADNRWFPHVIIWTDMWKEVGWGTIIYLAAITGVDPTLYEVASIDGANRLKQVWYVTIPGMTPIIVLSTVLSLGRVLNAGFDQIFNLYSPVVYQSGDIIDTLVYRIGLTEAQYSVGAAIGLFKSAISMVLVLGSYRLADKVAGYRVI